MIRSAIIGITALTLLGCDGGVPGRTNGQAPLDTAGIPPFSADSAYALLRRQVEFGPRVPGTDGHARQLAWMTAYLEARADTVIAQPFTHRAANGQRLALTNLLARFRPDATSRLLFLAHWDTRPSADQEADATRRAQPIDGANDGASGTAVLLELADVLTRHSPPIGVDLLFVDGEDYGPHSGDMYLGAKHFAATMPGYRPLYGVLVDMVADRNPSYPVEGYSEEYAPEVVQRVYTMAQRLGLAGYFPRRQGGYVTDDHVSLNQAGIRTINIIDFDYPHWHTLGDRLENTSAEGLGVVGRLLTAIVYTGG